MHSLTDRPTDGPPTIPQYVRQKDAELNAKETDRPEIRSRNNDAQTTNHG